MSQVRSADDMGTQFVSCPCGRSIGVPKAIMARFDAGRDHANLKLQEAFWSDTSWEGGAAVHGCFHDMAAD